jgi:hypothetical protein
VNAAELRILASLLLQLGMEAPKVIALFRQHGVTDQQIHEADLDNEIDVYERIKQLEGEGGRTV